MMINLWNKGYIWVYVTSSPEWRYRKCNRYKGDGYDLPAIWWISVGRIMINIQGTSKLVRPYGKDL